MINNGSIDLKEKIDVYYFIGRATDRQWWHANNFVDMVKLTLKIYRAGITPSGLAEEMLAEAFPRAEMNALELSAEMTDIAREVVGRTQHVSRVRFIHGSVDDRSLMAGLGKFDLVYSTFCLHHWVHPVRAIHSMHEAPAKGGLMMMHDFKSDGL